MQSKIVALARASFGFTAIGPIACVLRCGGDGFTAQGSSDSGKEEPPALDAGAEVVNIIICSPCMDEPSNVGVDAAGAGIEAGTVESGTVEGAAPEAPASGTPDAAADTAQCDPNTCASGCCSGTTCVPYGSQSTSSCGTSGTGCAACDLPNATAACSGGACSIASCNTGYAHCSSSPGCTDSLSSTPNCGACGHNCNLGTCSSSAGVCTPWTVTSIPRANAIASDGTNVVYFGSGTVMQIPVTGGNAIRLATVPSGYTPIRLAIGGGTVVWTTVSGNNPQRVNLWTAIESSANSGATMPIANLGSTGDILSPFGLAIDSTASNVYFLTENAVANTNIGLVRCTPNNGSCSFLVPGIQGGLGDDVALDASNLFYTDNTNGAISRYILSGSATTNVATGVTNATIVALDSTYVYWAAQGAATNSFSIARTSQTGSGSPSSVLPTTSGTVRAIATDGKYAYFCSTPLMIGGQSGGLGYVPVVGGTASVLSTGLAAPPGGLIAIGGYIIWSNSTAVHAMTAPL
jgi:hypothetical protein